MGLASNSVLIEKELDAFHHTRSTHHLVPLERLEVALNNDDFY